MREPSVQVRHKQNPFTQGMTIPVKGKQVKISAIGKDNNILVNQATGESVGTSVVAYKRVDTENFVKLFAQNIALTFELTAAGIKAFNVLLWTVQHDGMAKDVIDLDRYQLDAFIRSHADMAIALSLGTFWRGLAELEKAGIVAKHLRKGRYFINPNFIFNGDRIAFTTLLERAK